MQTFTAKLTPDPIQAAAKSVFGLISGELEQVELEFARQVSSNIEVIHYLGDYLKDSGGKRVRPSLLILSNYAVGGNAAAENVIRLATVMEMLHTATLVHDDIIDNAAIRRNRDSINAKFGNQTAVLMGDWLYMSAFETSLHERSLQILDILTTLTRKMTEGEIVQLTMLGRTDVTEAEYFDLLKRKTAYLFSACCEIGAILANANKKQTNALAEYGLNLGMAFQLADDLLDFTAEQPTLGKASGADLLEGKMTYPVIQLAHQHPEIKTTLGTVMKSGNYDSYSRADLTRALTDAGALEMTRQKAHQYAAAAIKNLAELSDSEYSEALSRIPSIMVDRDK